MIEEPEATPAPGRDLVERLRITIADMRDWKGTALTAWDDWRRAIANGDKGSWPRDAYESHLDGYADQMEDAADTITRLTEENERLRAALGKIHAQPHQSRGCYVIPRRTLRRQV